MSPAALASGLGLAAAVAAPGRLARRVAVRRVRSLRPPAAAGRRAVRRPAGSWVASPRLAALGAAGALLALGGRAGAALALAGGVTVHRMLARLPARAAVAREEACAAAAPLAADLVAAALDAGAPVPAAVDTVAAAVPGPFADDLVAGARRWRLGVPPRDAWAPLAAPGRDPAVRAVGLALARATETGAAPAASLRAAAADARIARRVAAEAAARRAAVVAVLPLGLCFLPAFVLVGVVPLVASLLAGVLR